MPDPARFIPSLPTLDLTGALDILLVAFVVYEALTVVRGTRAGHILIGILTMVSFYALPRWTGLAALRTLLSLIVPYISMPIIFPSLPLTRRPHPHPATPPFPRSLATRAPSACGMTEKNHCL